MTNSAQYGLLHFCSDIVQNIREKDGKLGCFLVTTGSTEDSLQMSIQQLPKHNEEMLTLKLAVEKAENLAQQAKKVHRQLSTIEIGCMMLHAVSDFGTNFVLLFPDGLGNREPR